MVDVTVTYGGQQYLITVPDTYRNLPDEQRRIEAQRFLGEQYPGLNITPPQPQPVDTSFGGAFRYGFDMPLRKQLVLWKTSLVLTVLLYATL